MIPSTTPGFDGVYTTTEPQSINNGKGVQCAGSGHE